MSYTPTTWNTGDTITAAAMNKIENGIANAGGGASGLVIDTAGTLNKTYTEISEIVSLGVLPFIKYNDGYIYRLFWLDDSDGYVVAFGYYSTNDGEFLEKGYISSTADGPLILD